MLQKLSILICHVPERQELLADLLFNLGLQIADFDGAVEVIVDAESGSTGTKRNRLISKAQGDYVCFVDDDDKVSDDYVIKIMEAIAESPDCVGMQGHFYFDGEFRGIFEHSISHKEWSESEFGIVKYLRCPNHLNPIKRSLLPPDPFPDLVVGEDRAYSALIRPLLKTEKSAGMIYQYLCSSAKNPA